MGLRGARGLLAALGHLQTLPVPPRWGCISPEKTTHVGQISLIVSVPPSPKAWKGSGREPGPRAIPPSCSHVTELGSGLPSAPAEPPAPMTALLAVPGCSRSRRSCCSLARGQLRDAAAKHPSPLPPLHNPSPERSISGAAASHPTVWYPTAASPRRGPGGLPTAGARWPPHGGFPVASPQQGPCGLPMAGARRPPHRMGPAASPRQWPCGLPIAVLASASAVSFPASPCAAGWEWYGPPSSARFSVDVARR